MKRIAMYITSIVLVGIFASVAWAVNLRPIPVAGVYTIRVQAPPEPDVAQVCLDRVDANNVQLERVSCLPATSNEVVTFSVTIPVTPGVDAVLRAVAIDLSSNESAYSADTATLDFTAPSVPTFVE